MLSLKRNGAVNSSKLQPLFFSRFSSQSSMAAFFSGHNPNGLLSPSPIEKPLQPLDRPTWRVGIGRRSDPTAARCCCSGSEGNRRLRSNVEVRESVRFLRKVNGFHSGRDKLVVAVDVDEVLGNFVTALNRFSADRYAMNHPVSEYHVYEFYKIWKCSRDEADHRVHEFFKTPYFKKGIHPLPCAKDTIPKLSEFCNLSVVTSRQKQSRTILYNGLKVIFQDYFRRFTLGTTLLYKESQNLNQKYVGATVLIDDNPNYSLECADVGIRVLLFDYENSYPWCKHDSVDLHPLVTRVHNWEAVEKQLTAWVTS